jgi:hypothetical protein
MDDARWRAGAFATEIEHVSMTDLIFNLSAYRTVGTANVDYLFTAGLIRD